MFWLAESTSAIKMKEVINTTRVGVSKAKDLPWRWYLQNSRSVSKRAKGDRCPPISQAWKPTLKES